MSVQTSAERIEQHVRELGPWFHNIDLHGVQTAPEHFLGDYPSIKWQQFSSAIPADLSGRTVLDIGCNGGFYAIEMKRRGASHVLAIDTDPRYLAQARFAADVLEADIEFRRMSVFDVPALGRSFDLVLFMGVLYHLRYPLLALDLLRRHAVGELMVFQTMLRGPSEVAAVERDYPFVDATPFTNPAFPALYFVEHKYAGDPTNWWIPNRAGAEAMLRSAGFRIVACPEAEVFLCAPDAGTAEEAVGAAGAAARSLEAAG